MFFRFQVCRGEWTVDVFRFVLFFFCDFFIVWVEFVTLETKTGMLHVMQICIS